MSGWILAAAAVAVIVAVIGWVINTINRFQVLLVKIREADSGIDVALAKRYDTLTKLIDVVKAYAKHETEAFGQVIRLRSGMDIAEKAATSRQMDEAAEKIRIIAESYPALRSSENYKQLQEAIMDAEDHLQAARRVYNMNVSSFNQAIVQFPASVIANRAHHTPILFFEAEAIKRVDIEIKST